MTPALPELTRRRAEQILRDYCEARVPARVRDQVRLVVDVRGTYVTIVEERPPWRADFGPDWTRLPIAQFRFDPSTAFWSLWWRDRNIKWHRFDDATPSRDIGVLLRVVDEDSTAIFWG